MMQRELVKSVAGLLQVSGHILLLHIQCCLVVINLFTRGFGH